MLSQISNIMKKSLVMLAVAGIATSALATEYECGKRLCRQALKSRLEMKQMELN